VPSPPNGSHASNLAGGTGGITISSHILDSAEGGGRAGVKVEVIDDRGQTVGFGVTDQTGRIAELAGGMETGVYQLRWATAGAFIVEASVKVNLAEVRHYHVPLLASEYSATVYLGA
jgi:5-hydroxyisourate hydrolase-like protein (transthyretin family)